MPVIMFIKNKKKKRKNNNLKCIFRNKLSIGPKELNVTFKKDNKNKIQDIYTGYTVCQKNLCTYGK